MEIQERFIEIKKKFLEREFKDMNECQREAVFLTEGQVIVLAGAGSGKTTALVNRVANIVSYGNAYHSCDVSNDLNEADIKTLEKGYDDGKNLCDFSQITRIEGVNPANILAITFTNKAAKELKNRLSSRLGVKANEIWASTFHAMCVKILRLHAKELGYTNDFVIYDDDDAKKLLRECQKSLEMDEKAYPVKSMVAEISKAKDNLIGTLLYRSEFENDYRKSYVVEVYEMYQKRLKAANAMDFDDLIFNTILLFKKSSNILKEYKKYFKYIMVDEYQDTNKAQHELIKLLAGKNGNLCVVGDDDQSIYKFRGATIENILGFEKTYKNAKLVRLEQNYRSTKNILSAANGIIKNNVSRKGKTLWTKNEEGFKIRVHTACNEYNEADFISEEILKKFEKKEYKPSEISVLYRMSSQSNVIERVFIKNSIAYKIIGGVKFYDRQEVKDLISYMSVINNTADEVRLRRIVNRPKRTIGERTITAVSEIAMREGKTVFEIMKNSIEYEDLRRTAVKLSEFTDVIEDLIKDYKKEIALDELYDRILERTGYIDFLKREDDEAETRIANIKELKSAIVKFCEEKGEKAGLSEFLEEVSLVSESPENVENPQGAVTLMTVHAAKGLEFPVVFLPGFEENIFPGIQSIYGQEDETEEERRLAYVAVTRAKNELYITNATSRMVYGSMSHNKSSRFLAEIPDEITEYTKARDWVKPTNGERIDSAYEVRVKSVVSARNFRQASILPANKLKTESCVIYSPGEFVNHKVFGQGTIVSVSEVDSDTLIEINFENSGIKKIMGKYSKLQKNI
jgi:DNA helicase-2/ATP-dependent DNA helicase PcrA